MKIPSILPLVCINYPLVGIQRLSGFTLIELMLVLVVATILAMTATPAFNHFVLRNQLTTVTNELIGDLNIARSEAIKRGSPVGVCGAATTGTGCTTTKNWNGGWMVFLDVDQNNSWTASTDTALRTHAAFAAGHALTASESEVVFNGQGMLNVGTGSYAICAAKLAKQKTISVSKAGAVRLADASC